MNGRDRQVWTNKRHVLVHLKTLKKFQSGYYAYKAIAPREYRSACASAFLRNFPWGQNQVSFIKTGKLWDVKVCLKDRDERAFW